LHSSSFRVAVNIVISTGGFSSACGRERGVERPALFSLRNLETALNRSRLRLRYGRDDIRTRIRVWPWLYWREDIGIRTRFWFWIRMRLGLREWNRRWGQTFGIGNHALSMSIHAHRLPCGVLIKRRGGRLVRPSRAHLGKSSASVPTCVNVTVPQPVHANFRRPDWFENAPEIASRMKRDRDRSRDAWP
jgi:hypothetical protein